MVRSSCGATAVAVLILTSTPVERAAAADPSARTTALRQAGRYQEAAGACTAALQANGNDVAAKNALAWLRATCPDANGRDGKAAVELARAACDATEWKQGDYLDTLGAAYAEAGDFENAVLWQGLAVELAPESGRASTAARLDQYRRHQPYREAAPPPAAQAAAAVPTPAPAPAPGPPRVARAARTWGVIDEAGLFNREAVRTAEEAIDAIEAETHIQVLVETVDSLNGRPIRDLAHSAGAKRNIRGVVIFLAEDEKKLYLIASNSASATFTSPRLQVISERMTKTFQRGQFDEGLMVGLAEVRRTLAEASGPPAPDPAGSPPVPPPVPPASVPPPAAPAPIPPVSPGGPS